MKFDLHDVFCVDYQKLKFGYKFCKNYFGGK